jgi:acetyl esterase/lipase
VTEITPEKNTIYGMRSGLALLMDVYHPAKSKGRGIIFVGGSGWSSPLGWDATGLKDKKDQLSGWVPALLGSGYTVFALNHRAAPRFIYPAALEDVQRAIRFVRAKAVEYGIEPGRIGAVGGSSGAHLICLSALLAAGGGEGLAAMLGAEGTMDSSDPVESESSRLQCLVLRAPPTDLWGMAKEADEEGRAYPIAFMEGDGSSEPSDKAQYDSASPVKLVRPDAPPILLIHGDVDTTVPFAQSLAMEAALLGAGVPAKLLTIPGGIHGPDFGSGGRPRPEWPDYLGEMINWLDGHLS